MIRNIAYLPPLCPVKLIVTKHHQSGSLWFADTWTHVYWRDGRWEESP